MLEKGMMTTKATTVIDYIVQRIADEASNTVSAYWVSLQRRPRNV